MLTCVRVRVCSECGKRSFGTRNAHISCALRAEWGNNGNARKREQREREKRGKRERGKHTFFVFHSRTFRTFHGRNCEIFPNGETHVRCGMRTWGNVLREQTLRNRARVFRSRNVLRNMCGNCENACGNARVEHATKRAKFGNENEREKQKNERENNAQNERAHAQNGENAQNGERA